MKARPRPDIIAFVTDPALLGLSLSPAQEALLRATYGLPMQGSLLELFRECTSRSKASERGFGEVTVLAGARGGKDSRIAAPVVCYEAIFGGHERQLSRGERAVIPLVAQDGRAARIAFGYIRDYLTGSRLLASMVEEVRTYEVRLKNRVDIVCFPSTQRSLRGWSIPAAVLDELAFFRLEGAADSDAEIQASIRRGMLSFPSPRLLKITTPYMRSGVVYEDFKAAFGQEDPDRLVWRASSVLMNPSLKAERLERERRLDPSRYSREYEAQFAEDIDAFLPTDWVEGAIVPGRRELPPIEERDGFRYFAAVDPSGGGADAFTFAIVHAEGRGSELRVVQDVMRGWARPSRGTVDLEAVVKLISEKLKGYSLRSVLGDRYAARWVVEAFQREGIEYESSERTKAEAYLETQPLFAQGRIELLDHPQLIRELRLLEARPRAGGKTVVDHPRGGHDDHANALVLAAAEAAEQGGRRPTPFIVVDIPPVELTL